MARSPSIEVVGKSTNRLLKKGCFEKTALTGRQDIARDANPGTGTKTKS